MKTTDREKFQCLLVSSWLLISSFFDSMFWHTTNMFPTPPKDYHSARSKPATVLMDWQPAYAGPAICGWMGGLVKGNSGSKWHSSINRCKSENVSPITGFFSILFFLDVSTWASWTCSFIDLIRDSEKTCLMHESWKIKNTSNICFMVFRNCLFHCFLVVGVLCFNLDIYTLWLVWITGLYTFSLIFLRYQVFQFTSRVMLRGWISVLLDNHDDLASK